MVTYELEAVREVAQVCYALPALLEMLRPVHENRFAVTCDHVVEVHEEVRRPHVHPKHVPVVLEVHVARHEQMHTGLFRHHPLQLGVRQHSGLP